MALQKQFSVKIYDQDGTTFLRELAPTEYGQLPSIRSQINGGMGEVVFNLTGDDFRFGDFGEGVFIDAMNIVTISAVTVDSDTLVQTETQIYKGFISMYNPKIDSAGGESLELTVLGLVSILSASFYMNGTSYTVTQTTRDPGNIIKDIIDHFNTIFGGSLITYTGGYVTLVGTTVSKTFTDQKWIDAISDAKDMGGTDWFFFINRDGQAVFKVKDGTPTHMFTVGLDVASMEAPKTMEGAVNHGQVRYSGGNTYDFSDATSQQTLGTGSGTPTGRWSEIINDSNITSSDGATQAGSKKMNDNKSMKVKATLVINSEYALESIQAGQTCQVVNVDGTPVFSTNMLIADMTYDGDYATLSIAEAPSDFALELKDLIG